MSSERPKKKVKTANDAEVSIGGSSSGGIHLTPELIARVATFADAVCSPDMMNICLAVGPESSRTVRHCYLRKRKRFLRVTMMEFSQRNISSERACSNHLAWMKVNADWRTLAVRDKFMEKLKLACKEGGPDQTAANFVHPLIAFNNPAVAIQIGLFDSLKHIVEDKGIDINSFEWTPFNSTKRNHLLKHAVFYRNEGIFKYLLNRPGIDIRCNADDVDEDEDYPLFDIHANDVDANYPLFDSLLWLSNDEGSLDSAFLKLFMKHPEFHINGLTFHFSDSAESFTPLYCAAILCVRVLIPRQFYEKMFQTVLQGTQILLSAGANPNLRFLPHCASPIDFLRSQKATAQTGELHGSRLEDFEAREKYWDEAIALLEKHA